MTEPLSAAQRSEISERRGWLNETLNTAKRLILDALHGPPNIQHKGRIDLVTETDLAVEALLTFGIQEHFPQDSILAEESGSADELGPYRWIIDPIDGTTNFSNRLPHFCVSVALEHRGTLVMASIYDPVKEHHFEAELGRGSRLNSHPISVGNTEEMTEALLATGFSYDRHTRPDNNVSQFDYMLRRCRGIRRMGAAALDFAYVAAGWLDGYWEYRLKPWDAAAGILLVEEAGGTVSAIDGSLRNVDSAHFCVANPNLHRALLPMIDASPSVVGSGLEVQSQ
jgi:myo-inositol-1(or 4)-monophosphatase